MKKTLIALGVIAFLATTVIALAASDFGITLVINGKDMKDVMDVPPQIIDGRTMVPARFVAEELGATVEWDEVSRRVTIVGETGAKEINGYSADEDWICSLVGLVSVGGDAVLMDRRIENGLADQLEAHFSALFTGDQEAFFATTMHDRGMEFPNFITFEEMTYEEAGVRLAVARDTLLTINEKGGRYNAYMPVLVWARKTADSLPELFFYHVGIEKHDGEWYITDWD